MDEQIDVLQVLKDATPRSVYPSDEWVASMSSTLKYTSLVQLDAVAVEVKRLLNICQWNVLAGDHTRYHGDCMMCYHLLLAMVKMEKNRRAGKNHAEDDVLIVVSDIIKQHSLKTNHP